MLDRQTRQQLLTAQKNEITEYYVYKRLAEIVKVKEQAEILNRISADELKHYEFFKSLTQEEVLPGRFKIFFCVFIS